MEGNLNELALDLEELKRFEAEAQREGTRAKLTVWRSQLEEEIKALKQKQAGATEGTKAKVTASPPKPKLFTKKITTYAWDQSDKFLKIFVSNLKGVQNIPSENVTVTFDGHHYTLNVNNLNNANYQLALPKLLHEVSDTSCKIKTDEVVIMLRKASPKKWETLSEKEKKEKEEKDKPPKMDKSDDPSKGIMDLMKKMYDEGDDDMKRTIAKAWTESREKQMNEAM